MYYRYDDPDGDDFTSDDLIYYLEYSRVDDEEDDIDDRYWTARRVTFIVITLLVILAVLVYYLPGVIIVNPPGAEIQPTPTLLPSI